MPSEHRLHPLSVFFNVAKQAGGLALPLLLVLAGARSGGFPWELLGGVFLIPYAIVAVGRHLTFRYRYEPAEMVIRTGFLFHNERHVPYARIQNIEAVQNVVHRMFGVVEVRVQTGGADEPEATMSVLPVAALQEMRLRVLEGRSSAGHGTVETVRDRPLVLLRLRPRDLLLSGFIENRGVLVVGAALGLLWELDFVPGLIQAAVGQRVSGRGTAEAIARAVSGGTLRPGTMATALAVIVGFLLFTRVLSMGWAFVRLHRFTVSRDGEDLRIAFGLFTRLTTTIPLRRIQQLTIRRTPLHRLFGQSSVRVATAGGTPNGSSRQREWLAPIIRHADVPRLLQEVLPGVDVSKLEWRPVHPGAFRRAVKGSLAAAFGASVGAIGLLRWWSVAIVPACLVLAVVQARLAVAGLAWATTDHAIAFRRGAFWRNVSIARYSKIQVVALHESPFDRRTGMATVSADTAGASGDYHVTIPYLDREVARVLSSDLAARSGRTTFRW